MILGTDAVRQHILFGFSWATDVETDERDIRDLIELLFVLRPAKAAGQMKLLGEFVGGVPEERIFLILVWQGDDREWVELGDDFSVTSERMNDLVMRIVLVGIEKPQEPFEPVPRRRG